MTSGDDASRAAEALIEASLRLATAARIAGDGDVGMLQLLAQQLHAETRRIEASGSSPVGERRIKILTEAYRIDAQQSSRYVAILYSGIGIALSAAAGVVITGLIKGASFRPIGGDDFRTYALTATLLGMFSLPLWWQAERHRRSAADNRRLAHQWAALEDYLQPLPERPQAIMRAALAPRIFSRPIEDDDPLKEPVWPTSDSLYPPDGGGGGNRYES